MPISKIASAFTQRLDFRHASINEGCRLLDLFGRILPPGVIQIVRCSIHLHQQSFNNCSRWNIPSPMVASSSRATPCSSMAWNDAFHLILSSDLYDLPTPALSRTSFRYALFVQRVAHSSHLHGREPDTYEAICHRLRKLIVGRFLKIYIDTGTLRATKLYLKYGDSTPEAGISRWCIRHRPASLLPFLMRAHEYHWKQMPYGAYMSWLLMHVTILDNDIIQRR